MLFIFYFYLLNVVVLDLLFKVCIRLYLIILLWFSMLNKVYFLLCNVDIIYFMSKEELLWFVKGVIY